MIGLLLLASAWGPGTVNFDGWPPRRFRQDSAAQVSFVQPSLVGYACRDPDPLLEACQWDDRIVLPNPCTFPATDDYARLACHELAHRNGWPVDHPR
jgi:hypothetical protein